MKKNKFHKTNTYIGIVLLIALGIVFITACASTGQGKSEGMELVYETDFSTDDGGLSLGPMGENNEIREGVLHLKGIKDGEAAHANLEEVYGNNSITTFRIKFGERYRKEGAFAYVNFLWNNNDRVQTGFVEDHFSILTRIAGQADNIKVPTNFITDQWYDVQVAIMDYRFSISIDGRLLKTLDLDERLPSKGHLNFECHEEFWIDDLRIVAESSGMKDELPFDVKYEEIGRLMKEWEEAIRTRDHNRFAGLLWPETELYFTDRKGRRTDFHGIDAIREFRLDFFKELDPFEEYRLPEPRFYEDHGEFNQSYDFMFEDKNIYEALHFAKRDGTWKIQHLEVVLPKPGSWVTNRYQVLGDKNGDGFLHGDEHGIVYSLAADFFMAPHTTAGPMDKLFDADGSGYIDEEEIRLAGEILFHRGFLWLRGFVNWAVHHLDLNGDGEITDNELELIYTFMSGDEWFQEPRAVGNDLDGWMDKSGDGQVSRDEITEAREYFIHTSIHTPCPDALFLPVPRNVSNYLDELADGNGDGRIDQNEQNIILQSLTHYHDVSNYLERALDLQHDGKINSGDVFLALQASALGKGIVATKAEPPYPVVTPMDRVLDPSGDGFVDQKEINIAASFLAGDTSVGDRVSKALRGLTDCNDDGRIEAWEIEEVGTVILHPHPVNRDEPLDKEGDVNRDGFIDPDELGISAGVTGKGEAPTLDERIRLVRHQLDARETDKAAADTSAGSDTGTSTGFQSEYYRRLGKIQDRKLAVISLATETAHVDEETASGIIVFVENAFVNVGKVRVVDRKNIEDILSEYKFQSSGLVDENTAIEIGKLSGADIIVMGSINRVGGIFYLNIKLIDVKTAEIIGSNIAQAKDATGFLDMCNQVVYMLF